MMQNGLWSIELGLLACSLLAAWIFRWAFRHLPSECWQIAVAIPARSRVVGDTGPTWPAVNITFYGVISAIAYMFAVLAFVFLAGAANQPIAAVAIFSMLLLLVGIPASKWVALWVEGVPGHTIGGALFAVVLSVLPALSLTNMVCGVIGMPRAEPGVLLASAAIAYVLGEAIGRLACLSFGCCYGRSIDSATPLQRALYSSTATIYRGRFKKIAYASGLDGHPVIAVQSVACAALFGVFIISVWFFWKGHITLSLIIALGLAQLWRAYSETLRADYRGREGFTVYQGMALVGVGLTLLYAWIHDAPVSVMPTFVRGLEVVTRIEVILCTQALAIAILALMGRSYVTSSRLEYQLHAPKT
jgi:hypothetical protein